MTEIDALIKKQYENSRGDSSALFQTMLSLAESHGWDRALASLEQCVIEKRSAWLDKNLPTFARSQNPVRDGYRLFYVVYLGVSVPQDGEIVEENERSMVTRWWNRCPTLEACQKLGLDTRVICKQAYHRPVQEFLARIHPGLRFDRNYAAIRPHQTYCEEIISLTEL